MSLEPSVILFLAVAVLALVVGLVAWRLRSRVTGGARRGGRLHGMDRDDSIGYFRDFGRTGSGVREEDKSGRWGAGQDD